LVKIINIAMIVLIICALTVPVAAAPAGVNTANMNTLVTIIFWAVRLIILAVGAVPAVVKIVQGQADENPRDRNAGIATVIISGICFAATFGIELLFK
jgi:hypothetical protein